MIRLFGKSPVGILQPDRRLRLVGRAARAQEQVQPPISIEIGPGAVNPSLIVWRERKRHLGKGAIFLEPVQGRFEQGGRVEAKQIEPPVGIVLAQAGAPAIRARKADRIVNECLAVEFE